MWWLAQHQRWPGRHLWLALMGIGAISLVLSPLRGDYHTRQGILDGLVLLIGVAGCFWPQQLLSEIEIKSPLASQEEIADDSETRGDQSLQGLKF
jgi:hypothetical protein